MKRLTCCQILRPPIFGLDGLSEEQVLQEVGEPIQVKVTTETSEWLTEVSAPRYLVRSIDCNKVRPELVTNEAYVIDLGESFKVLDPLEELGIPEIYHSPELLLDQSAGLGSDLWAFGCTLFEIRTGRKLFNIMDADVDGVLYNMVLMLGNLPEPGWATGEARKTCFEDEGSATWAP
jgi:hypothetical protein